MNELPNDKIRRCEVYYDSTCKLCNSIVTHFSTKNTAGKFAFIANNTLNKPAVEGYNAQNTLVVINDKGQAYAYSDAVLTILKEQGGGYLLIYYIVRAMPRRLRDYLYKIVARNRHKLF